MNTRSPATDSSSQRHYICPACDSLLAGKGEAHLACPACAKHYPVIERIPILVLRPRALLNTYVNDLRQSEKQVTDLARRFSVTSSPRIDQALLSMRENVNLTTRYMKPVMDYLAHAPADVPHLNDWVSSQTAGWTPQLMLPYFYQDWAPTKEFSRARTLLVESLCAHRPDSHSLALLGAGACGLARACAAQFERVHAVDLSVPTLLVAEGMLRGEDIRVRLRRARWREAQLRGADSHADNLHLVVADVSRLPFATGSLSAVVTQYLIDIVANPLGVAAEIARVLKTGGIWVNFSTPFSLPGEPEELPRPSLTDVAELLQPLALEMIVSQQEKFALLDLTELEPAVSRGNHQVHFFIARQRTASPASRPRAASFDWDRVPRPIPGREVRAVRTRPLMSTGETEQFEIAVGAARALPVAEHHIRLLTPLFKLLDGQHTLRQIFDAQRNSELALTEPEFQEFFFYLIHSHGLFSLHE